MDMDLRGNLEQQVDELELLQSIFSAPGEFQVDDQSSYDQVSAFLKDLAPDTPGRLSCKLHIPIDAHQPENEHERTDASAAVPLTVDISIRLPHSYPEKQPEVYVSSNGLTRRGQDDLNSDLKEYVSSSLPPGDVCLLSIVEWIRDNAGGYFPIPNIPDSVELESDEPLSHFSRMWLYMHHIYSKTKRRDILSLAQELDLTGFCLPGKPGVVCIEGEVRNTKEFYTILRRWNWKSITCRKREVIPDSNVDALRRISGFQELVLDTHGQRQNHMDMGQFLDYLRRHKLEYMFKILFGVEGHMHTASPQQ